MEIKAKDNKQALWKGLLFSSVILAGTPTAVAMADNVNTSSATTQSQNQNTQQNQSMANAQLDDQYLNPMATAQWVKGNPKISKEDQQTYQQNLDDLNNHNQVDLNNPIAKARSAVATIYLGQKGLPNFDAWDVYSGTNGGNTISANDFRNLYQDGVHGLIIKADEGTSYVSPTLSSQYNNAKNSGMTISTYHYAWFSNPTEAVNEANHYADQLDRIGIDKRCRVFLDLEERATANSQTGASVRAFFDQMSRRGYNNHGLYTFTSYSQKQAAINVVGNDQTWMAAYPYNPSGSNLWNTQYGAWQFSSTAEFIDTSKGLNIHGYNDISVDYKGLLTRNLCNGGSNNNNNGDGQRYINGKWYYYRNGQPVKNQFVWVADQNKECYYGSDGAMVYGQAKIDGHWMYFDTRTGAQAKNAYVWLPDQHKEVYYDGNGWMVYGQRCINGQWQFFDKDTGAQLKNSYLWIPEQNKEVFYDANGNMIHGQAKINGHWQWFDPQTGAQAKNQFVWINDEHKECFYDGDGNMTYGQAKIDGHWMFFDKTTGAQAKNTYVWIDDEHKECHYDGNGWMTYGDYVTSDGHHQFFDTQTGRQYKHEWRYIKDKDIWVYYDDNGDQVFGDAVIDGHHQWFDLQTGKQAKGTYVFHDGHEYFYDNAGNMVTGQQYINGHWQYFGDNGVQAKNTYIWITDQHKECFYDGLGNMVYGDFTTPDRHHQFFDTSTGAQYKNQWRYIADQNKWVFYDSNGNQVFGQYNYNGHWYYYDPKTGAQAKDQFIWITDQNKLCYYNPDGTMAYGWNTINGHTYYFDKTTGAQYNNCTANIDGHHYQFASNGWCTKEID